MPGFKPAAAAMAARLAPPSPAGVTNSWPAPGALDVTTVEALSLEDTRSCFELVTVVAAEVSAGDVTAGAAVAMAGAREMTVAVLEATGPRAAPTRQNGTRDLTFIPPASNDHFLYQTELP